MRYLAFHRGPVVTVKVRQLTRVSGGFVPPPPPPVPTMAFTVQPTDTIEGELFDPPVTVQISDNGNDSLTISSDNCSDIVPVTVTATAGLASFLGLRAGSPATGCRLRVHNNSRPQVQDIVSDAFNVLPVVIPTWSLIATDNNFQLANVGLQPVSVTMNTMTANLLVVVTGFITRSGVVMSLSDSEGNGFMSHSRFGPGGITDWAIQGWSIINPATSSAHSFTVQLTAPQVDFLSIFSSIMVAAFHLNRTPEFINYQGNDSPSTMSLGLVSAVSIPPFGLSISSLANSWNVNALIPDYTLLTTMAQSLVSAYRINNATTPMATNPTWSMSSLDSAATNVFIFGPS